MGAVAFRRTGRCAKNTQCEPHAPKYEWLAGQSLSACKLEKRVGGRLGESKSLMDSSDRRIHARAPLADGWRAADCLSTQKGNAIEYAVNLGVQSGKIVFFFRVTIVRAARAQ
jgi:hypothetical protein